MLCALPPIFVPYGIEEVEGINEKWPARELGN